jgi:hypothetical protein
MSQSPLETKRENRKSQRRLRLPKKEEPAKEKEKSEPVETKASFDINYWISFAKEAAVSKGLTLESSAVDCWDNPITAKFRLHLS